MSVLDTFKWKTTQQYFHPHCRHLTSEKDFSTCDVYEQKTPFYFGGFDLFKESNSLKEK